MFPSLTIPDNLEGIALFVVAWAAALGTLSIKVTEWVIDWQEERTGADVSRADQRLVSVIVPPVTTLFLYGIGLLLGLVQFNSRWAAVVVLVALAAIGANKTTFASGRKMIGDDKPVTPAPVEPPTKGDLLAAQIKLDAASTGNSVTIVDDKDKE